MPVIFTSPDTPVVPPQGWNGDRREAFSDIPFTDIPPEDIGELAEYFEKLGAEFRGISDMIRQLRADIAQLRVKSRFTPPQAVKSN